MRSLYGTGLLALSLSLSACANALYPRQNSGSDSSSAMSTITETPSASSTDGSFSSTDTSTATCTTDRNGNSNCSNGGSNAQEEYLNQVCQPKNSTGDPDLNFPCNAAYSLLLECLYNGTNATDTVSPAMQQQCFCPGGQQAALWQNAEGCSECARLHGANRQYFAPIQYVSAESSSYCAAPTMTQALDEFLGNWTASSTISIGTSTGGTDVIGNKTDINSYFTPTSGSNTASTTTSASSGTSSATAGKSSTIPGGSSTSSKTGSAAAATSTGSAAVGLEIPGLFGVFMVALGYFL